MAISKVFGMIGLAARAGKVGSGAFVTEKLIKNGKARLVILSKDASDNTKKDFTDMCSWYKVPICIFSDRETLGNHIGKEARVVLAITDSGFADRISNLVKDEEM